MVLRARIALLNRKARAEIEEVVERIEKVETAIEPRFQEHFVAAMAILAQDGGLSQSGGRGDTAGSQGGGGRRRGSPPPPGRLIEQTCALSAYRAGTSQKGRLPSR